jgi:hypothetical protein
MSENHGPFHRLGEPGGPACPVGVLPITLCDAEGRPTSGSLLDAGAEASEIELLRTIASRLGVKWGCDALGWWAVVKEIEFPTWAVWRQDDHGNSFLVEANLTKSHAENLQAELEARGHKQTYWAADAVSTNAP